MSLLKLGHGRELCTPCMMVLVDLKSAFHSFLNISSFDSGGVIFERRSPEAPLKSRLVTVLHMAAGTGESVLVKQEVNAGASHIIDWAHLKSLG